MSHSKTLLYLADNTGEIVFDKILIEEISHLYPDIEIFYAVRGAPIINDCTLADTEYIGMDKLCKVISNGYDAPGKLLEFCSDEFLELWQKSDMVISKGQGNFESLSSVSKDQLYFLFIAKCRVLTQKLGCDLKDVILCRQSDIND